MTHAYTVHLSEQRQQMKQQDIQILRQKAVHGVGSTGILFTKSETVLFCKKV
jgi:hypothetical protein